MAKLKALAALAQREDALPNELRSALATAEAALAASREASQAAGAQFESALLAIDDETALQALSADRDRADLRIRRIEAIVGALREKLVAAENREAEAQCAERFEKARRLGDDAARALVEMYPRLASDMVSLLEIVARADVAVKEANADRPRGSEPLPAVEGRVRDLPGLPEEVVAETVVERWVRVGHTLPTTFDQNAVKPAGSGHGYLPISGQPLNGGHYVELRRFVEREALPGTYATFVARLAEVLTLPGLRAGEPAFFEKVERPFQAGFDANYVLARIAHLRGQAPQGEPIRAAATTLVPLDPTPVQAPPDPPNRREVRTRYND